MQAIDLNGKSFNWNLSKYVGNKSTNASGPHLRARKLLHEVYPALCILEEVLICEKMRLDFFISVLKIAVEVQGSHHSHFVPLFHQNDKRNFYKGKARDNNKALFCELNDITLIYFFENESDEEWKNKLQ